MAGTSAWLVHIKVGVQRWCCDLFRCAMLRFDLETSDSSNVGTRFDDGANYGCDFESVAP